MTEPRSRKSDLLGTRIGRCDPEFLAWCSAVLDCWREDAAIEQEWLSLIHFFDFAFDVAEALIRSATKK